MAEVLATGKPAEPLAAIGFLTVIDYEPHGLFGGYLVLNTAGRPLEFHCTTPVRPNRAQQILYGPTLEPYLYGEQIGRTLVEKAKVPAPIVLTDVAPALALREHAAVLIAVVEGAGPALAAPAASSHSLTLQLGKYRLRVPDGHSADIVQLNRLLAEVATRLDLTEPFQRIRDAINEAHKAA